MSRDYKARNLKAMCGQRAADWFLRMSGSFQAVCPQCSGKGKAPYDCRSSFMHGRLVDCGTCMDRDERLERFAKAAYPNVPMAYRSARLRGLEPSEKSCASKAKQQQVIDMVRANPDAGYAFFGPPCCGKTHITTALYIEQLWRYCMTDDTSREGKCKYFPIWRISTKEMLDQHTDWAMRRNERNEEGDCPVEEPKVTAKKIAYVTEHGRTPRLFLEEIDKVKETESRRANLFEILNAMQAHCGQLVINSNYTPEEFARQYGDDLAWRIAEMCTVVNYFEG